MTNQDQRLAQIHQALKESQGKSLEETTLAVESAMFPQPSGQVADLLWTVVVFALAIIAGLSLLGLVVLLAIGKSPDLVLTAFTSSVTGLLGLFVKSPVQPG